ncbi:MAG TPA: DUF3090 family protein [Microthrixaceae bacterium]|nr:DUF3090 family protein [Microthrixaceae bacterium]
MDEPIEFDELDSFTPGAVGEPGSRIFYIQARRGTQVVSLRLEKEQVGMLGGYLDSLATSLGSPDPDRDIAGLIEPVVAEWIVGTITVGLDDSSGLIQVTAEELVREEIEFEVGDDFTEDDIEALLDAHEPRQPASARFTLRPNQAAAFAEASQELISSGRPPCRLCGRPIGPEGHNCPRWN